MSNVSRGQQFRIGCIRLCACAALWPCSTTLAAAQSATVKLPVFGQRIDHPQPSTTEAGSEPVFGYTMVIGDVDAPSSTPSDDIVISAFFTDLTGGVDAGRVYAFAGPALGDHAKSPITPATIELNENFGRLTMDLADVVGSASDPGDEPLLLFVPAPARTMDLSSCSGDPLEDVGAIDVYDLSSSSAAVLTITPPPIPGESPALPCGVRWFGHWLTHGDVDGDDYDDLIVGAPNADESIGRVYIFFGHPDFLSSTGPGYTERWMILRPPPSPSTGPGFVDERQFGFCVSAADLDDDGKAEVLVGSIEHAIRSSSSHGPGRAFLFHGYWLASQLYYPDTFADVVPPGPPESPDYPYLGDINLGVGGIYETLVDTNPAPFGPTPGNAFGWIVEMKCGDLGQPTAERGAELDDRPDIIIHSEGAHGYGRNAQTIVNGGGLFVFMNDSVPESDESLVDEASPARLLTPRIKNQQGQLLYYPQSQNRFGRGFATLDWQTTSGSPTRLLVVGEPERTIKHPVDEEQIAKAGAVYAFELPLDPDFDPNDLQADHLNAWGQFVLLEPAESLAQGSEEDLTTASHLDPQDGSFLGGWIVAGKYDTDIPGDQLIVSARARDVTIGSTTYPGLGRVYAVTLPSD